METACSVISLRFHNIIFVILNFILCDVIMLKLSTKEKSDDKITLSAFVVSLFPVSYFFTFLYYTDQGSLCCVLLSYWLSLWERHIYSGLVSYCMVVSCDLFTYGSKSCKIMYLHL